MIKIKEHPSRFALDCHAVSLNPSEGVRTHVVSCEQCKNYIAQMQQALPLPEWARNLTQKRSVLWDRIHWGWIRSIITATTLLVIVIAMYNVLPSPSEPGEYTTTRGSAAVGLYVLHDSRVSLWNGVSAIEPGDRLRLKIIPDGYTHVSVFTILPPESEDIDDIRLLYFSTLDPNRENVLPAAWEVDEESDFETLIVVLGHRPITKKDFVAFNGDEAPGPRFSIHSLVIPKRR